MVNQPHNHVFIEKLMEKYATLAASYCAVTGTSNGVGIPALAGFDTSNMAAQLYRLNQKMAILNGFDPHNSLHQEKSQMIYLKALGFNGVVQAAIRKEVIKAAAEDVSKSGVSANITIRLIMEVTKLLGINLNKAQTVKLIPYVGAVLGGGVNYWFAKNASKKMIAEYKSDYFDRWQASSR